MSSVTSSSVSFAVDFNSEDSVRENIGGLTTLARGARDLAKASTDSDEAVMFGAAADYLGAVVSKATWLHQYAKYTDGASLKNACFAAGYMQAVYMRFMHVRGKVNTQYSDNEQAEVLQTVDAVVAAVDAFVENMMTTSFVTVQKH